MKLCVARMKSVEVIISIDIDINKAIASNAQDVPLTKVSDGHTTKILIQKFSFPCEDII